MRQGLPKGNAVKKGYKKRTVRICCIIKLTLNRVYSRKNFALYRKKIIPLESYANVKKNNEGVKESQSSNCICKNK